MKYQAVIFDLFGTLVDSPSLKERNIMLHNIASALSIPRGDFIKIWNDTFTIRDLGKFQSFRELWGYAGKSLGIHLEDLQTDLATGIRLDWVRKIMTPREEAPAVLFDLKSQNYKIGLISDCSFEVPLLWKENPLAPMVDKAIFSCSVGLKKPDLLIYEMMLKQLEVKPDQCLYIGDGSSHELTGASKAGMQAVLIQAQDSREVYQTEAEGHNWKGQVIHSLKEVLDLVE